MRQVWYAHRPSARVGSPSHRPRRQLILLWHREALGLRLGFNTPDVSNEIGTARVPIGWQGLVLELRL